MCAKRAIRTDSTEPPSEEGRWLTIREAAERVGVDPRTIWRWIREGLLVARRGHVVRIWSPDLDRFLRGE